MADVTIWREAAQHRGPRWRGARGAAAVVCGVLAALALAGCSSFGRLTSGSAPSSAAPSSAAPSAAAPSTAAPSSAAAVSAAAPAPSSDGSFTSRVKSLFSGSSASLAAAPAAPGAPASADVECPAVEFRLGAATLAVNDPGVENSALSLRYQASFLQTARECAVRDGNLNIKVGVQGRIVVGPAGGPGQLVVPLRYALVREGLEPRTIWTKLFLVPVTIPEGQPNALFVHIEEEMTAPLPPAVELDAYVIYVGFDPEGAVPAKPPPKAKPKPKTAARTP